MTIWIRPNSELTHKALLYKRENEEKWVRTCSRHVGIGGATFEQLEK